MDLKTVVTISTLLLITAVSGQTTLGQNNSETSNNTRPTPSPTTIFPSASTAGPNSTPSSPVAALGLLTITWHRTCEGDVNLSLFNSSISSLPICNPSGTDIRHLLGNVCENQKGCTDRPRWLKGLRTQKGYNITLSGAERHDCKTLRVQCTDVDVQGQLQAYKVVTALLCCLFLLLILIRFTRPTVKALQKRLSERRQNRWVGPTQSHSVSYHRGKTAVKTNDAEKRLSYPALERLAVSDSREPSSNRNSDYNF